MCDEEIIQTTENEQANSSEILRLDPTFLSYAIIICIIRSTEHIQLSSKSKLLFICDETESDICSR